MSKLLINNSCQCIDIPQDEHAAQSKPAFRALAVILSKVSIPRTAFKGTNISKRHLHMAWIQTPAAPTPAVTLPVDYTFLFRHDRGLSVVHVSVPGSAEVYIEGRIHGKWWYCFECVRRRGHDFCQVNDFKLFAGYTIRRIA